MESRPDPDALLRRLQAEEEAEAARTAGKRRGRLKVFMGMAAGVGKTFEMLREALDLQAEGVDVVAGYVEPHGRPETERMLEGLETLSFRWVDYRGVRLREFDLDAALARRPAVLLVDEFAHTNTEGSRHPKRWQDVEELLDAGIDVYTTMNVQHVESLNDVVARITGVVVRETVPDAVVERADTVELVDLPPGDLLKRLDEGRVYPPERAQQAKQHFFKEDKLTALRQIALRFVADRVDARMERFRRATPSLPTWAARERVLVCVSPSPLSAGLVRAAKRLAGGLQAPLYAVFVEPPAGLSDAARARVAETLRLAEGLGAEVVTLGGPRPVEAVLDFARRENVTRIVVGKPTHPRWRDRLRGSFLDAIVRASGPIEVLATAGEKAEGDSLAEGLHLRRRRSPPVHYLLATAAVAVLTGLSLLLYPLLELEPVNVAMLMLLGIVGTAVWLGRGPSVLASLLSVLAFNYFFIPPRFTFYVEGQYVVTFAVMPAVALVIAALTARVRDAAAAARERERRTEALLRLSRDLVAVQRTPDVLRRTVARVGEALDARVVALLPDEGGRLQSVIAHGGPARVAPKEGAVAEWAFAHGRPAGRRTDTLPSAEGLYLPLTAGGETLGVLALFLPDDRALSPDERSLAEAFVNQAALALKRSDLAGWLWPAAPAAERPPLPSTARFIAPQTVP
jgi:two-component system sensor histidine kinase KdpD